jgi:hypothetical protein
MIQPPPSPHIPARVVELRCCAERGAPLRRHHLAVRRHLFVEFALQPLAMKRVMNTPQKPTHRPSSQAVRRIA